MGSFASSLVPATSEAVPANLKPSNPGWIPAHIKACNAPILKVQRCWHRFVQLGSDRNGVLTEKAKVYSSKDKFLKQILALIPKNEKNAITFQVFVNGCMWLESADSEVKTKLLFYLMNKGEPVNAELFTRVISHLYQGVPQKELDELATVTVQEISEKKGQSFTEIDFVKWVMSKPQEEIEALFAFSMLPS